jgi:O-6-methylguanine DNA methyltransferase
MLLHQAFIETPVSVMRAISLGDALCSLEFFRKGRMARLDARLARWFKDAEIVDGETPPIAGAREWLRAYFAGESADISALTLEMRGAPFERRVWEALRKIPVGTTTTYGAVAREVGSPDASRAVGMANGANPIAIIVPCHRVIGSNGTLTGYGGGLETKSWLLSHERRWAREPALF